LTKSLQNHFQERKSKTKRNTWIKQQTVDVLACPEDSHHITAIYFVAAVRNYDYLFSAQKNMLDPYQRA
jgi:hypothetical protein